MISFYQQPNSLLQSQLLNIFEAYLEERRVVYIYNVAFTNQPLGHCVATNSTTSTVCVWGLAQPKLCVWFIYVVIIKDTHHSQHFFSKAFLTSSEAFSLHLKMKHHRVDCHPVCEI